MDIRIIKEEIDELIGNCPPHKRIEVGRGYDQKKCSDCTQLKKQPAKKLGPALRGPISE